MISVYHWDLAQQKGQWLDPRRLKEPAEGLQVNSSVIWIDLEDPDPEEERLVYQQFLPIHPLSLEDITKLRREPGALPHFPKVEEFRDYLFVIVNPLNQVLLEAIRKGEVQSLDPNVHVSTQLSAILTRKLLITHHYELLPSIEALKAFLFKHATQGHRGPDYLFHLILDAMVDQYAEVLDHFTDLLDDIETRVIHQPTQQLLLTLLHIKRRIIQLRKSLVYEREVLARMTRGEFELIDEREMVYYRNVYDHLVRFTELTESSREMVSDLMQTHLAAASNRLNEIMKVLTMISTIVLPMTLIAGIYGMNFPLWPDGEWPGSFWFALGLMAVTGITSFIFFRWKKWI
ncbi:MAG TPA: magnesium/cobalt transporter CorA [Gemmataceae bacterium]|nr:magnesium/cobalt transporter CorA [Gemmataceae bacterium]